MRRQTATSDEYAVFSRTICRRRPRRAALAAVEENELLMLANERMLAEPLPPGKNSRMLFITDTLDAVGGVETRLFKLLNFLEKKTTIRPCLLTQHNAFKKLEAFDNLHLRFDARNVSEGLLRIVGGGQVGVVEFQFKNPQLYYDLGTSIDSLKRLTRVGGCFHSQLKCVPSDFDALDYQIVVSERLLRLFPKAHAVPNWISESGVMPHVDPESRKALFISRIDNEKLPTLKNFVALCRANGIDYDIAGPVRSDNAKVLRRLNKLAIAKTKFIGPIDTTPFLKAHAGKYLFASGVGQAALEAASLGMPVLIASHTSSAIQSTFLTNENFSALLADNLTVKDPSAPIGNTQAFFAAARSGTIDSFFALEAVRQFCSESALMTRYMNAVFGEPK